MIFKTTLKDINAVAVAIDKLGKITSANMSKNTIEYSLYGKAIEGLSAKQLALALSTQKLTPLQIEQIIKENDLIKTYGAEVLVKEGLISVNSTLLVSEKAVYAQDLQKRILQRTTNKEEAKEFIQKNLIVAANGEEAASTVLLTKALMDEAVERGILTEKKAAEILSTYGVVIADFAEVGSKKSLNEAIKELIASKVILSGLDVAMLAGVAALVFTIYKCNKAVEEAKEKAQELGSSFKNASSEIDDYKSKIDELQNTIHDSNSSIEDVTEARKSLMSIQDELIDKYGTEQSVIDNITKSINGQTEALNNLTQAQWQETKNEFNNGGFWNDAANFFQGQDNIERMLDEYGEKTIALQWVEFEDISKLTDEMVAKLENIGIDILVSTDNLQGVREFNFLTESIYGKKGPSLAITGNAEEIYNKLIALQTLAGDNSLDKLYDRIESTVNSYKDLTDTYKDFYNQYILYEKILTDDSEYADKFKDITDAYEEYNDAFISGDEDRIKEATEKYAETLTEATAKAIANGDSDVATYFESMYPALKSTVEGWKFNVAFDANTDNLQNEVQSVLDELKDENGRALTAEEILGLGEENEQYKALISIARSYNMTLEEMIELLKQRKLVSAMDYQGLVGLFGQDNVNKLSPEDLEIAYTIKNIGNMSFGELQAEIKRLKDTANETDILTPTQILSQVQSLSTGLDQLGKIYTDVKNQKDFDWSSILNNEEFAKTFSGMGTVYDKFIKTVSNAPDDIEACQNAFNKLATSYIYNTKDANGNNIMDNLTEGTKEATVAMLEQMGVVNALEVVEAELAKQEEVHAAQRVYAARHTTELTEATLKQANAYIKEAECSEIARKYLAQQYLQERILNGTEVSTEEDCQNLIELAKTAGYSTSVLTRLEKLKKRFEDNKIISETETTNINNAIRNIFSEAKADIQGIDFEIDFSSDAASDAASSAAKSFTDLLDKELAVLDKKMEAGYMDFNDYIKARLDLIEDYYHQGKISADEYYSYLEKHYDTQLSYMDKVINAVTRRIDKEIDGLEKQKDDIEGYYKVQIDALEKQKTLLQEANREKEREYNLQKSLYDLERARNQMTKLVDYMPDTIVI